MNNFQSIICCRTELFKVIRKGTTWLAAVATLAGCSGGPSRLVPPEVSANAGTAAIKQFDTDGNGTLSSDELSASPALKSAMAVMDKDGDAQLSAAEIDNRIDEWRDSKVALTSVMATVRLDGRPLAGAEIAFVPESFMGDKTETAKGTTDERGMVRLRISDAPEGRGVRPGLYKIRISKLKNGKQSLPQKYVDGTELGIEVVTNSFDGRNPILELKSR
jgi:hypothetical protein